MLSAFLIKLFNMSIAAGFVVLAVVLARLVLKRAPKWLRCALWVLVAVRLIIPTLPQSTVSLVPSAETIVIKQIDQSVGQEQNGSTDVQQDPEPFDMPYTSPSSIREIEIHSGIPFINSWAGDEFTKDSSSPAEADPGKKVSFLDVAGYLWLGGLIIMVCYAVVSFAKLRAKVRASVPRDNSVYVCDDIDSPFILGVIRPRIYLPSGLSADAEAHVLAHERAHLSRRDQLWKPVGYLLLSIYWFNPLMWLAYVLFCRDIEYACDEKVVGSLNETDRADYSRALLSCSVSRRVIAACPLAFGEVGVKDRVKSALNYKKPAFWVIIAAVLICLVLAVCFLTNPRDKAMQGKVTKWFEDEQYAAGQGRVITLPEYPGVEFRKEGHIYMVKDGKEEVVVHAAFIIKNAYFCDLNGDGKPELCTTCEIGSGLIDERVVVYCPADGSTLELQDRGNFDYMLDERDGKLIVMKRAYERTSSVGEDGLLAMKDGKLIMAALSDGSGKSPTSPPELTVVSDRSSVTVKHSGSSWQKGSRFGGVESIIEDSPGLGNEIFRKGLKVVDVDNSSWVALSFSQQPDLLEVYVVDESTLLGQGQSAAAQIGVYDEKMISIPSGETYCIVHAEWAVRKGTGGNAYYYFKTVSSVEPDDPVEAPTVQSLVIDTLAQAENLHHITNRASIETAYGIYSMYAEGPACQKEEPSNEKQLLILTFTMTDGTEQIADFYQEDSGKYYMDKKYNKGLSVEKTVSISEEDFNTIKDILNTKISDAEKKLSNHLAASDLVRKALMEDWAAYHSKSEEEKLFSNKMPGWCWEYFNTWKEATAYLGTQLWNPLERADWLEKKNYAGADLGTGLEEGYMHAYLYWGGSEDGNVSYYMLQSGYALGRDRIVIQISSDVQSMEELKRTDRSTDKYYAIDMEFPRDGLQYKVTVSSFDGAESCKATSAKILDLLFPGSNSHIE